MANLLPLTVSSKTTDIALGGSPIEVNPFANMGITAADAPVLLSLGSKGTVDADAFAARMVKAAGQGTRAEARLFINALAAVLDGLVEEYGAVTVNTPFGTIQTFIAGTLANPQDQPDPSVNYAFLGVVIPETYRKLFAQIATYVPADACPAALKRVRDKATDRPGICGTEAFYLEGRGMTIGGEGETLELLDAVTRDKVCDISVDAESKSPVQFLCTLSPQTAIEAGEYLVRLMTLAGGETTLWPVELKVELLEAVEPPAPAPHIDRARTDQEGEIDNRLVESLPFSIYGSGFGPEGTVKVSGVDTDGQPKTVEIPSGAIASWSDGEIRVEGEGWEPISAQLDLANPIGIVVVRDSGESNVLEATVYA